MTDHHAHGHGQPRWSESARQVWLAGVGAWTRAQAEGSRVFDGLVRDGLDAERAEAPADGAGPWDRMGQFLEDALQKAMLKLGVARRQDVEALGRQIEALTAELAAARARDDAGAP